MEAVRQVTEHGRPVAEVAQRLGITSHSLYAWKKALTKPEVVQRAELDQSGEVRRLKAELKRMTEERDILKKAAAYFAKG
jgi:transposase